MDPNETLRLIGLGKSITAATRRRMADLHAWLRSGGFAPDWDDHPKATRRYRRAVGYLTILTALALAACGDELYDPTGTWAMNLTATAGGTCGITGTSPQQVLVTEAQGEFFATTSSSNETTTGSVLRDADHAQLSITITNHDPLGDGGSAIGTLTIDATADADMAIAGAATAAFSGSVTCTQALTIHGALQ